MSLALALLLCLQAKAEKAEAPKADEPWSFKVDGRWQFADTMIADPFRQPLASEILDRKDSAIDLTLGVTHEFFKYGPLVSFVSLEFHQVSWFKYEEFNLSMVSPSLSITVVESPVVLTQVVGTSFASVGGDPFAQEVTSVTGLGIAPVPVVVTYAFSATEYQGAAPSAAEDRDGVEHSFLALATIQEKPLSFKLGVQASWITTDGSDFDRTEWGPIAILEYDLFWDTKWRSELKWMSARYHHVNSFAAPAAKRSDGRAEFEMTARKKLIDELTAVAGVEYRNAGSNVAAFDYDRLLVHLGLELKF